MVSSNAPVAVDVFTPRLLYKIAAVESGRHGDRAYNARERARGRFQIREAVLRDVNTYYGSHYTVSDCFNHGRSVVVLILYCKIWDCKTEEEVCRVWNGGPGGMKKESTKKYYEKVTRQ